MEKRIKEEETEIFEKVVSKRENEVKRILKEIEDFDGDYVLSKTDGSLLLDYIFILEEELKDSNKSVDFWINKWKEQLELFNQLLKTKNENLH